MGGIHEDAVAVATKAKNADIFGTHTSFLPTIENAIMLIREPLALAYAAYWYWCLEHERHELRIRECGQLGAWNPRKNVTYIVNNTTHVYDFPRSPEDFRRRYFDISDKNYFQSELHKAYLLYSTGTIKRHYGDKLLVYTNEQLYDDTDFVLNDVCRTLGLPSHDFSALTTLAVNVAGRPGWGPGSTVDKRRGFYPPMTEDTYTMARPHLDALCGELERTLNVELCEGWV